MRLLKAALVGIASGVLLTAALLVVDLVCADRVMAKQMAQCEAALSAVNGGGMCDAAVQFGHVRSSGLTFVIGFAVGFAWFVR